MRRQRRAARKAALVSCRRSAALDCVSVPAACGSGRSRADRRGCSRISLRHLGILIPFAPVEKAPGSLLADTPDIGAILELMRRIIPLALQMGRDFCETLP